MSDDTGIEWTDATWNPIRGCSRVSEGCRHCYAERVAARFSGPGQPYEGLVRLSKTLDGVKPIGWNGTVRMVAEHLADPLRWKKPRRVFVNSMSDLFHESLTNEQIAAVFGVMAAAPRHTYQVLTKRAKRMREWFAWLLAGEVSPSGKCYAAASGAVDFGTWWRTVPQTWPLPNVWIGVSVENQAAADERIPELLATPAAVRWISAEPLIGPVRLDHMDVERAGNKDWCQIDALTGRHTDMGRPCPDVPRLSWVVAGCESGPGARPCDVAWLRSLRDQCAKAGVAYFVKQAKHVPACIPAPATTPSPPANNGWVDVVDAGPGSKRKAGGVIGLPYLDGRQHIDMPEVTRG